MKLPRERAERQQLYILMRYMYAQKRMSKMMIAWHIGITKRALLRFERVMRRQEKA